MTKMNKSNLALLKKKQQQAKAKLIAKESDINNKLNYLEHHFGSMVLNSIMPTKSSDEESISSRFLSGLFGQLGEKGFSQILLGKMGGLIGYKLSGFLLKLLKKYI